MSVSRCMAILAFVLVFRDVPCFSWMDRRRSDRR